LLSRTRTAQLSGYQAPRLRHWLEVEALLSVGDRATAERIVCQLEEIALHDEPLSINLALARHALNGSSLEEALNLAQARGWTLRARWLKAKIALD
jgi:hypothetical protein